MNRIIKISWILIIACLLSVSDGEARLVDSLSLYGAPKYPVGFSHFAFVNANAPKGGSLVLPAYGSFDNFNPYIFRGIAFSDGDDLTLESLGYSPADDIATAYPLLAKKFEVSKDGSFVGFVLDEKAKFSDGSPVTADDVIFSFKSLIEKGSPVYKIYYADVERVEKVNTRQVRFYFKQGISNRELPLILTRFKIFSAKDFANKDFATPSLVPPLGSGPYVIAKFEPNKFVELRRNEKYWGKDLATRRGFFNFDRIRFDFYQDTTVTLQALFSESIDAREEYIAKIWASGYNNKKIADGTIIKEEMEHNNPAVLQFFGFNTRLPKLQDRRVRKAIGLAFNFDWANKKLFYSQYKRIYSVFSNTDFAAEGLPEGDEKEILLKLKDNVPESVFKEKFVLPDNSSAEKLRHNLKEAVLLLEDAGYGFRNGKMVNLKTQEPLEIEVLSNAANGSSFTRVMLPFIDNLAKIGIKLIFRNLEVNVFKNRLDKFDFEMAILSYRMSNMPGNEQREIWGSEAADVIGSYNFLGVKNEAIDKIIDGMIATHNANKYKAYVKALDRVIMHEYYFIPQWYSSHDRVAYNKKLKHPQSDIKTGFDIYTWWIEE